MGNSEKFKLKLQVFTHYSNGKPRCACCGEKHIEFLTIDHINGGGTKERKEILQEIKKADEEEIKKNGRKKSGAPFYRWLIENNFPEGYQVMCSNCNMAKGQSHKRYCPVHHPELYRTP